MSLALYLDETYIQGTSSALAVGAVRPKRSARQSRLLLVLLLLFASFVLAAKAGMAMGSPHNLVENGHFDHHTAYWSDEPGIYSITWSDLDAEASSTSGSLQFEYLKADGTRTSVSQCILVTPGERYRFGATARVAADRVDDVRAMVLLRFYQGTNCPPGLDLAVSETSTASSPDTWVPLHKNNVSAPAAARSALVTLIVEKESDVPHATVHFDDVFVEPIGGDCESASDRLCLQSRRFGVEVDWQTTDGATGRAKAVPFVGDSGLLWFFDPANLEVLVKVLDGCGLNGHYWVFAAATTNVAYRITVTDSASGAVGQWLNPQGEAAAAITDTTAFATCP
jgi:hypothetical protein